MRAVNVIADDILSQILHDLHDRSGIGDEWRRIDVDIRNEMLSTWRGFIVAAINGPTEVRGERQ